MTEPAEPQLPVAVATFSYKHHEDISQIRGCPFCIASPFTGTAYRAIHADVKDPRNFAAAAMLNPNRFSKYSPERRCSGFALSMYASADQLKEMIQDLKKSVPLIMAKIGDHCAEMKLRSSDGHRTIPDAIGHFDFFEFSTFDAEQAVVKTFCLFP